MRSQGAAALVLMAADTASKLGIKPLAVISGTGIGGCALELMWESPVPAIMDMLKKTGHKLSDYGRIGVGLAFKAAGDMI